MAVVAVLVFHFSEHRLPGGFAGVDVFFVISGFLMTAIITRGLQEGNFSFWRFMKARARRIVPALMCVVLLTMVLGYLVIDPANYKDIGKHGASSLLFISNYIYNQESGYFDATPDANVFLHSWSLSIEWQFYILYALLLMLLCRLIKKPELLRWYVLGAAVLYFGFNLYLSYGKTDSTYYLLSARAWEMLAGGIVFLFPLPQKFPLPRWSVELFGLILILVSFFVINENMAWPGLAALLPIAGASLLLLADNPKTILGNVVFQKIGLISYSLYLLHWVVIALFKKTELHLTWLLYLGITFAGAFILYQLIEKRRKYSYVTFAVYLVLLAACYAASTNGFAYRIQDKELALDVSHYSGINFGGVGFENDAQLHIINPQKEGDPDFILTGDSLARQYSQGLKARGLKVATVFTDACFSTEDYISQMTGYEKKTNQCLQRYATLKEVMKTYPHTRLVVAQNWRLSEKLLQRSDRNPVEDEDFKIASEQLDKLIQAGGQDRQYYFVGQPPYKKGLPYYQCLARSQLWLMKHTGFQCPQSLPYPNDDVDANLMVWTQTHPNAHYVSIAQTFCGGKSCPLWDDKSKQPIYTDGLHFSAAGADRVLEGILKQIGSGE